MSMSNLVTRPPGEKLDITVYADLGDYAAFPQLARTDDELALLFQVQNLEKLRAADQHPHNMPVADMRWATSRDGGRTWSIHETSPWLGSVRDISYGSAALADGGVVTLTFHETEPLRAIVAHGDFGYRPYGNARTEPGEHHCISDLGPFERWFCPFGIKRLTDGTLLASGYAPFKSASGRDNTTVVFLASTDEGRTWRYRTHVPNPNAFAFSESDLIETRDGRLVALLRTDWDGVPVEQRPPDRQAVNFDDCRRLGYGWYLYQTESRDGGRTWSEPVQLPLWGHPPCLLRLAGGDVLLLYGCRREPWEVHAIRSRDEGRTWDPKTLRVVHRFTPGNIDFGYPVATQLADGSIVCAFYGYSTPDIGVKSSRGIFVSIFDEMWLGVLPRACQSPAGESARLAERGDSLWALWDGHGHHLHKKERGHHPLPLLSVHPCRQGRV